MICNSETYPGLSVDGHGYSGICTYSDMRGLNEHFIVQHLYCIPKWLSLIFLASHQVAQTGSKVQGCAFSL